MKRFLLLSGVLLFRIEAQIPDLDAFGGDLELDLPATVAAPLEDTGDLPPAHLFAGWEHIREFVSWKDELPGEEVQSLPLPEGSYLVAPNVGSIAEGYTRLADTLSHQSPEGVHLLRIILHADGKFSVALWLPDASSVSLPPGVDISPVPETELIGFVTDIQVVDRSNPLVLQAFISLQNRAKAEGRILDRREFFFLPIEPGRVFFGLLPQ